MSYLKKGNVNGTACEAGSGDVGPTQHLKIVLRSRNVKGMESKKGSL